MARNALNHTILESRNLRIFTVTAVLFISFIFLINPVFAADPGTAPSQYSKAMIPASNLVYPLYDAVGDSQTELSITNTGDREVIVKLNFVVSEGGSCVVADFYITLTPHQVFLINEDSTPGIIDETNGFLSAYAVDAIGSSTPINYNYLVGSARIIVIDEASYYGEYNAFGFRAIAPTGSLSLIYDDVNFEKAPRTIAAPVLTSSNDYNTEMLVLISLDTTGIGQVFGLLYDDAEQFQSFTLNSPGCSILTEITPSSPEVLSGRTGWMKLYKSDDKPMLGLILHNNPNFGTIGNFEYGVYPLWALTYTNGAYEPDFLSGGALP